MLKVLDVDGAVRRVRGGWESTGAALDLRRGAAGPGRRGPRRRGAVDARLRGDARLPDGVPAPRTRRSRRAALRALRHLHRSAASRPRCPTARSRPPGRTSAGPASRSRRARQWPTALDSLSGKIPAGRAGRAGRRLGRSPTSAGASGCAGLVAPRRRTRRCRPSWSPPSSRAQGLGDRRRTAGRNGRPVVVGSSRSRHPGWSARWRRGSRRSAGCRCSARSTRAAGRRPGQQRSPRTCPRRRHHRAAGVGRAMPRWTGRCCSSTTTSTRGWTMALAARALRRAGAPAVLPLALGLGG